MENEHVRAMDRIFVIVGLVQSLCVRVFVYMKHCCLFLECSCLCVVSSDNHVLWLVADGHGWNDSGGVRLLLFSVFSLKSAMPSIDNASYFRKCVCVCVCVLALPPPN